MPKKIIRDIMSVYIPKVSPSCDEAEIRSVFEYCSIGKVDRVEFVRGSAFVHLDAWYSSTLFRELYNTISYENGTQKERTYILHLGETRYWMILKNTSVSIVNQIFERVCHQDERIAALEKMVNDLLREEGEGEQLKPKHTRFIDWFGDVVECLEGYVVQE
jgi:hypothetical protein